VTIIFVSHRIPEIFRLADRVTVLRDGTFVRTFDRDACTPDDVVRSMVGREPPERVPRETHDGPAVPALALRDASRGRAFRHVSLDVCAGEIVGLFGLVGSGRSELLEAIFGVAPLDSGVIEVGGRAVVIRSARQAARVGLALVPEERHRQGLFFNLSIRDNIGLPRAAKQGERLVNRAEEQRVAEEQVRALSIRTPGVDGPPDALSGGNQQKVVTAKWLATEPSVLLLDEPTKGVDVGAKFEIHRLIREQARRGMACLVVSSELPEVLSLADRILIMRQGRLRGELSGADATEEAVMQLAAHDAEVPA
jgi:ABC-type sugar transport system ATPase subunit